MIDVSPGAVPSHRASGRTGIGNVTSLPPNLGASRSRSYRSSLSSRTVAFAMPSTVLDAYGLVAGRGATAGTGPTATTVVGTTRLAVNDTARRSSDACDAQCLDLFGHAAPSETPARVGSDTVFRESVGGGVNS